MLQFPPPTLRLRYRTKAPESVRGTPVGRAGDRQRASGGNPDLASEDAPFTDCQFTPSPIDVRSDILMPSNVLDQTRYRGMQIPWKSGSHQHEDDLAYRRFVVKLMWRWQDQIAGWLAWMCMMPMHADLRYTGHRKTTFGTTSRLAELRDAEGRLYAARRYTIIKGDPQCHVMRPARGPLGRPERWNAAR